MSTQPKIYLKNAGEMLFFILNILPVKVQMSFVVNRD